MSVTPKKVEDAIKKAFDAPPSDVPHWSITPDFDDDGKIDGGEIEVEVDIPKGQ